MYESVKMAPCPRCHGRSWQLLVGKVDDEYDGYCQCLHCGWTPPHVRHHTHDKTLESLCRARWNDRESS